VDGARPGLVVFNPDTAARLGGDEFVVLLEGRTTSQTGWMAGIKGRSPGLLYE
jgi:GGDEF domain-containing protein